MICSMWFFSCQICFQGHRRLVNGFINLLLNKKKFKKYLLGTLVLNRDMLSS